jgi:multidrug transporter EmrE-like cation transporter
MITKYIILILAVFSNALGSILAKKSHNSVNTIINSNLILSVSFYGAGFIGFVYSLKSIALNIAHPTIAIGGILIVALYSYFFNKESYSIINLIGVCLMCVGIILLNIKR